jgi:hypothetical protein
MLGTIRMSGRLQISTRAIFDVIGKGDQVFVTTRQCQVIVCHAGSADALPNHSLRGVIQMIP